MGKRVVYLDVAKGILIILMLIGHIWDTGYLHDFIYTFHMAAFFIISGIQQQYSSSKEKSLLYNLLAKIKAYAIPYICFEIYGIIVHVMLYGASLNIKGYLYEMLMLHLHNGPLWFLIDMFLAQMLFVVLYKYTPPRSRMWILVALSIAVMLLPRFDAYINISTTILGLFLMLIGYLFADRFSNNGNSGCLALAALIITAIISRTDIAEMAHYQDGNRLLFIIGGVAGTYFILWISQRIPSGVLNYYGKNSLILLGSHYPLIRITKYLLDFEVFSALGGVVFLIVLLALELPIIALINRYLPFVAGKPFIRKENLGTENKEGLKRG